MKYSFIEDRRTHHSVQRMCRLLGVLTAGFYEWHGWPQSARAVTDAVIAEKIARIHAESHARYGRPHIHAELVAHGFATSEKRVGRLMKARSVKACAQRRFRKTTDSAHDLPIAANLVERRFDVARIAEPNRIWAGDVTYLPTREGWLYLAVVMDLVSRRVIG